MHRYGQPNDTAGLPINMMAPLDPQKAPAMLLQEMAQLLAGKGFHTAISKIRSFPVRVTAWISTDKHPSMAS